MSLFQVIAILLALTALFSYINHRYLRLHPGVGVMVLALVLSLLLVAVGEQGFAVRRFAAGFLQQVNLNEALLQWMLGFLLFAGALAVDLNELSRQRWVIALLATAATIASMVLIALPMELVVRALGFDVPLAGCFAFGALISPTDPVAIISFIKRTPAPRNIETIISAESLLNDGVGVVLFLALVQFGRGAGATTAASISWLFVRQSLGGAAIGLVAGAIVYQLLRRVDDFQVEVLLTLALAMGAYAAAEAAHVSAPIAAVVAGLLIGNPGRTFHLSEQTRTDLEEFWELVEEVLNTVLFVLIGLNVLLARWLSVHVTVSVLPDSRRLRRTLIPVLTWGGLRGGLAVAMALSLPATLHRDPFVAITYGVVLFSILVQGTTMRAVIGRLLPGSERNGN